MRVDCDNSWSTDALRYGGGKRHTSREGVQSLELCVCMCVCVCVLGGGGGGGFGGKFGGEMFDRNISDDNYITVKRAWL